MIPPMILASVDLPLPLWPRIAALSPLATKNETRFNARPVLFLPYENETEQTSINGGLFLLFFAFDKFNHCHR